jgi:ABC-type amino acid transport substrate-binding protein
MRAPLPVLITALILPLTAAGLPAVEHPPSAPRGEENTASRTISMVRATWDTGRFRTEIFTLLPEALGYEVGYRKTMENLPFYSAAACRLLEPEKVEAVVYDAPVLQQYAATKGRGKVGVVGRLFQEKNYGMAFRPNSACRDQVNVALLKPTEE